MSFDAPIKPKRSCQPVFPDRCVVCHAERPGSTIRITSTSVHWLESVAKRVSRLSSIHVPACALCRRRAQIRSLARTFLLVGGLAVSIAIGLMLADALVGPGPRSKGSTHYAVGGVISVLCYLPFVALNLLFLREPMHYTVSADAVEYDFSHWMLAKEFAELNRENMHAE